MATTYKNTNNCLLFFTPKNFLDSIDTIFQFHFVETNHKWVLEFRPVNELIWQRKPVSIALSTNHIDFDKDTGYYQIATLENNVEEDVLLLKVYNYLHAILIQAINKDELNISASPVSVKDLKLYAPYHFDDKTFPDWLKQPGKPTLRISNGGVKDNYANNYIAFNNWKYIEIAKREASNKKRKLESSNTMPTIPESESLDTSIEVMSS